METTTQTKPDNATREDVLRELEWDPKISSDSDIAIAVKDGVVTLSGFVPIESTTRNIPELGISENEARLRVLEKELANKLEKPVLHLCDTWKEYRSQIRFASRFKP
jgi:hypothetical protein